MQAGPLVLSFHGPNSPVQNMCCMCSIVLLLQNDISFHHIVWQWREVSIYNLPGLHQRYSHISPIIMTAVLGACLYAHIYREVPSLRGPLHTSGFWTDPEQLAFCWRTVYSSLYLSNQWYYHPIQRTNAKEKTIWFCLQIRFFLVPIFFLQLLPSTYAFHNFCTIQCIAALRSQEGDLHADFTCMLQCLYMESPRTDMIVDQSRSSIIRSNSWNSNV